MSSNDSNSEILEWYRGRTIFITGGTGFMGKVLVEKLLYTCDVDTLYVLMRSKRGKSPEERLNDIWKLPMFERLRKAKPDALSKIRPIHGDIVSDGLGMSVEQASLLAERVSVVFHCAATLKLEATLKDAVEMNTAGTQRVVDVARTMTGLKAFIHMSTAFCSADIDVFEERLYPSPENPRHIIEVTRWMNEEALVTATAALIRPHPNCYTYSKRLAETLVANELGTMRVAIVRPSIVTPACFEPLPGWVDSLNGPMGLLVAAGKGVLRSIHCKSQNTAQVIPVDYAINGMLLVAYNLGSAKDTPDVVPVYNMTNSGVQKLTWKQVLDIGRKSSYKYPFEMMIWYPDGDMRSSHLVHRLCCLFMHWLPAYLIDGLMFVLGQKRFMVRIQNKIHDGLELLQFFTTREWQFKSSRFLALSAQLAASSSRSVDQRLFAMDFNARPLEEYLEYCVRGAREYCMKEDPSTLPRCRLQQHFLFLLHHGLKISFYLAIVWWICSSSETVQSALEYVCEMIAEIPVVGALVPMTT